MERKEVTFYIMKMSYILLCNELHIIIVKNTKTRQLCFKLFIKLGTVQKLYVFLFFLFF